MTTIAVTEKLDFYQSLIAPARSPEIPEQYDIYGWLIGSWELDVLFYWTDVSAHQLKGEAHFGWVLEGRTVQDVWIIPRNNNGPIEDKNRSYGTTLRVWDPTLKAWQITWINPVTGAVSKLIGRRIGQEIIQVGARADGTPIRWNFTEITADSFLWTGEALDVDGKTWKIQGQFRARRIS